MSWAEHLRAELLKRGHKVTVTAILIKAIAIAQHKHPASRTSIMPWGGTMVLNEVTAGFTCERVINGQPAVYFGIIKEPDRKPISQIARELKEYSSGEIDEVPQLEVEHRFAKMPWLVRRLILWAGMHFPQVRLRYLGATFGISSLGKFGVKYLIPPCVTTSTIGIGAVENQPVVRGGEVVIRPMMGVTLNFDHRLIDGAPAAVFLRDIRLLLEGGLAPYVADELAEPAPAHDRAHPVSASALLDDLENAVSVR